MCLATSNNLLLMLQDAPKCVFFHDTAIFWSAKKRCKVTFFPTLHPLSLVVFATATVAAFLYCYAILGSTSIVIHSMKQCLLRNLHGNDATTSRNILHERLQRAFTHTNQLHWTAQESWSKITMEKNHHKEKKIVVHLNNNINNTQHFCCIIYLKRPSLKCFMKKFIDIYIHIMYPLQRTKPSITT